MLSAVSILHTLDRRMLTSLHRCALPQLVDSSYPASQCHVQLDIKFYTVSTSKGSMLAQALTSVLAGLALLVVYVYRLQKQRNAVASKPGCGFAVRYRSKDPLFGMDCHMGMHVDIPSLYRLHQRYGKTFQLQSLVAQPAIMTLDPRNIRTVNTAKEFGIEPMRLAGMEYFCGHGFLTTDGDIWQHSRKLLKPGFAKSNLVNLDFLSQQVDEMLSRLPADGETVDLQPLLYTMVGVFSFLKHSHTNSHSAVLKHVCVLPSWN
jgi:hypothetical protein